MTVPPDEYAHPSDSATIVDRSVGARIRLRRTQLALTQEELAGHLGLSFVQVRDYEQGANRLDASHLFDLARVLDVEIGYFFEDVAQPFGSTSLFHLADTPALPAADPGLKREILDLVRTYYSIADPKIRRQIIDLARSLANG